MKFKLQPICLVPLTLAMVIAGCATTGYYRLKQTQMDVDFAMTRYQNQVSFDGVTTSFQSQVTSAYQAYKTAFDAAVQQAHSNYDAPTPENVRQRADLLLSILSAIPVVP